MKRPHYSVLPLSLVLLAESALAQESAPAAPLSSTAGVETAPESSSEPAASPEVAGAPAPAPGTTSPPEAAPPVASLGSPPPAGPPETAGPEEAGASWAPFLAQAASEARLRRYGEGLLGLTAGGTLLGVGFAAEAPDMTWSHVLWVAGGVAALGSVGTLFVPSDTELLERRGAELSDAELGRRWEELATKARVMRRTGAVVSGLFGIASITLGVLSFEGELGTLTDDQQRIVGSTLVGGGALAITQGVVNWFVPTPLESGFAMASAGRSFSFGGGPSATGFHVTLTGAF